jgi:sulfur-oxidizing protein SoxY
MTGRVNRRRALALGVAAAAAAATPLGRAAASNGAAELVRRFTGGRTPVAHLIALDLPDIAPDGNMVPLSVAVESPMTEASHVTEVLVVAEQNPHAAVAFFRFTPQSGAAEVATRIRLARSQTIVALARTSEGAVYVAKRHVDVTVGGCGAE